MLVYPCGMSSPPSFCMFVMWLPGLLFGNVKLALFDYHFALRRDLSRAASLVSPAIPASSGTSSCLGGAAKAAFACGPTEFGAGS